jgi:hypothetical protein
MAFETPPKTSSYSLSLTHSLCLRELPTILTDKYKVEARTFEPTLIPLSADDFCSNAS